jgi:hypothetical protein
MEHTTEKLNDPVRQAGIATAVDHHDEAYGYARVILLTLPAAHRPLASQPYQSLR